jgi:hypothetical protein
LRPSVDLKEIRDVKPSLSKQHNLKMPVAPEDSNYLG